MNRTWWPTFILFESTNRILSRNITLIDANLVELDNEKLGKINRTVVLRGRDLRNAVLDRSDLRKAGGRERI